MQIKTAAFVKSSAHEPDCPEPSIPEYAFIGRSNVGKSSLINALTNRKSLAKTSGKPGKTQLINHFLINEEWHLVDLPGYGWAKVSKTEKAKWSRMIDDYIFYRQNLIGVFVLVDSRLEPQKPDMEFIRKLGQNGVPFTLVFTKTDKLGKTQVQKNMARFKRELLKEWEELPKLFMTSSVDSSGKEEILAFISGVLSKSKD